MNHMTTLHFEKEDAMKVVIFAAGLSTRLRPCTNVCPKPMLPVAQQPMLLYIIEQLRDVGLREIIFTTHYLPSVIRDSLGNGTFYGVSIRYAHEEKLMDTAGSLRCILDECNEEILAVGGNDYLPNLDIHALVNFHRMKRGVGTIAFAVTHPPHDPKHFGQGVLDEDARLQDFAEKPEQFLSSLLHTTYQIYNPVVKEFIPEGVPCSIPRDLIPALLRAQMPVYGFVAPAPFLCISTKEEYAWTCAIMEKTMLPIGGPHDH